MENTSRKSLAIMLLSFTFMLSSSLAIADDETQEIYIVLLQKPEGALFSQSEDLDNWYNSFLPATTTFPSEQSRLVHSYRHVVTGFAAKLTATEVEEMKKKDGFVSARPRRMVPFHTTHTPSFLGLDKTTGLWHSSNGGKGMIIGLIDSGILADHPSFSGKGMPPPPAKWKGKCDNPTLCNNKLIGLRNFALDSNDTSDEYRHGTHTAGTAAGGPVEGASFFGQANGTAVGMAPLAHVAMYKVSGRVDEVGDSEILAAMEAAIMDGVDVLSLSLGSGSHPFYDDVLAIGAFAAFKRGIFVSCSAGNSGPFYYTLSNEAPWVLTVGGSTVDRAIRATVLLGNNEEFNGESLFQPKDFPTTLRPLVYAASCEPGSLRSVDVKGKIVLCEGGGFFDDISIGREVKDNGGAAMILMNVEFAGYVTTPKLHVLPMSQVSYVSGLGIKDYINSTSSPKATILFKGTVVGSLVPEAPQVAVFSSRGPSVESPGIMKPDIIGPAVRVLAAWPVSLDNTTNKFDMISGTSMSCPHLAGVATLLKSAHPDWSPAAIKSAIMTTASLKNVGGNHISDQQFVESNVFDMGAGHVNPNRATDPGLIYDIGPEDYVPYLCGLGYSNKHVGLIVQEKVKCSRDSSIPESRLNYPSFSVILGSTPKTYTRTLTNVGQAKSVYTSSVLAPKGVDVKVQPDKILFTSVNEKATYSVTFTKKSNVSSTFSQGYLSWVAEGHNVRSPIAILFESVAT